MGGVFVRVAVGRRGGSAANVRYITRGPATRRDEGAILARHYPEYVLDARDYGELRGNLEAYARQCEEDEQGRRRGGDGEPRSHYRVILSCEDRLDTARARELADEYLDRTFPDARALAVVHQDTDHTHVHIHLQARDIHDRKLYFGDQRYRDLDRAWAEIYGRETGRDLAREHLARKEETRAWRRDYAEARLAGREPPRAPDRADRRQGRDEARSREGRGYGADEAGAGGLERAAAGDDRDATGGDRAAPGGERLLERAARAADRLERDIGDVLSTTEAVLRELERDREHSGRARDFGDDGERRHRARGRGRGR